MKTVLVVSYIFPPLGGAGTFRWLKLSRYLGEWGYRPIVLSAEDPSHWCRDESLTAEVPPDVRVIRLPNRERRIHRILRGRISRTRLAPHLPAVRQAIDFPDDKWPWAKDITTVAIDVARRERPAAIVTTAPPYSAHVVGLRVKRKLGLPWVADFRDPWSDGSLAMNGVPGWLRRRHEAMERRVARAADHCLFVYPGVEAFCRRHGIPVDRASQVFNGYDPADFADWPAPTVPNGRVEIVHTGSFYGVYNPSPLARALRSTAFRKRIPIERLRLTFVGGTGDVPFDDVPGLNVRVLPRVSHAEALRHMGAAHVLVCVFTPETGNRNVTGKVFEYVAAQRPILAIVPPEGAAADVVRRTGAGYVADPDDPTSIAEALEACIEEAEHGGATLPRNDAEIARFSRRAQAGQVAAILDRVSVC